MDIVTEFPTAKRAWLCASVTYSTFIVVCADPGDEVHGPVPDDGDNGAHLTLRKKVLRPPSIPLKSSPSPHTQVSHPVYRVMMLDSPEF